MLAEKIYTNEKAMIVGNPNCLGGNAGHRLRQVTVLA